MSSVKFDGYHALCITSSHESSLVHIDSNLKGLRCFRKGGNIILQKGMVIANQEMRCQGLVRGRLKKIIIY